MKGPWKMRRVVSKDGPLVLYKRKESDLKRTGFAEMKLDPGEPAFRSCWECNAAHEHLKDTSFLHWCFSCGRYWIFGRYLDEFETDEDYDAFLLRRLKGE